MSYTAIPIPQRARAADEELTRPLAWLAEQRTVSKTQQVESVYRTLCQYVICFPSYPREGNTGQLKHAQPDFQIVFIQEPFSPWTKDALWTVQ